MYSVEVRKSAMFDNAFFGHDGRWFRKFIGAHFVWIHISAWLNMPKWEISEWLQLISRSKPLIRWHRTGQNCRRGVLDITKQAWAQPVDLNSAMPRLASLALMLFSLHGVLIWLDFYSLSSRPSSGLQIFQLFCCTLPLQVLRVPSGSRSNWITFLESR